MVDVNLNEQLLGALEDLRPELVSDNILLSLVLLPHLWQIRVDPYEVKRMLAALLAESCSSLPEGGVLTIETANQPLSSSSILDRGLDLIPSEYVMLSVSNTGICRSPSVNVRLAKSLHKVAQSEEGVTSTSTSLRDRVRESGGDILRYNSQGGGESVSVFLPRRRQQASINRTLPLANSWVPR